MLNQIVLVGKIEKIEKKEKDTVYLTLGVPRSFKNTEGEYETDHITCKLFNMIAENTAEYCKIGDIVGVKGRLENKTIEKYHTILCSNEVVAEKVTFLSPKLKESE